MDEPLQIIQERVDSLPVILETGRRLGLVEALDECLGSHGNLQGLSYGQLALGWLGYILAENDHRKSVVEVWADGKRRVLGRLLGSAVREGEFNDDRLGRLLQRLADEGAWQVLEERLWTRTAIVFEWTCDAVRLDSTTSYGYHAVGEDGLMQLGHSKDRRPDLPQFKLMAAVAEPAGQVLATAVHPGNAADDGLYLPMAERVRAMVGAGKLYVGDAKMAALATRAAYLAAGDQYLTRLPVRSSPDERERWIDALLEGLTPPTAIVFGDAVWGEGVVHEREQQLGDRTWTEQVYLYRSIEGFERRSADLDRRLAAATEALRALSPPPGRGRRQLPDLAAMSRGVDRITREHDVAGMLMPIWRTESWPSREDPERTRIVIDRVHRRDDRIDAARVRLAWQVLVSILAAAQLPLADAVRAYNDAWRIDLHFRDLWGRLLGVRPLHVATDAQIRGLTHLLTLGLRILSLITQVARRSLRKAGAVLEGLYDGQPSRTTDRPTARRLLHAFHRLEITLVLIRGPAQSIVHITPLPDVLARILDHMGLSHDIFTRLALLDPE